MRAAPQAITITISVVCALASCRAAIGVDDPLPPYACPAPAKAPPSCGTCLHAGCCDELEACGRVPACKSLVECESACADDACRAQCETDVRPGPEAAAVLACEAARCGAECGLICGGAGSPVAGCQACGMQCCDDGRRYRASLDGELLRSCWATCASIDVACRDACVNAHAEGADLEHAVRECLGRACTPGDWTCVGSVAPQLTGTSSLTITVRLLDVDTDLPVAGALVKGCAPDDVACASPAHGSTTTGPDGVAHLTVTLAPALGGDAFGGYIDVSRDDYVTSLFYFAPPLTADFSFALLVTSKAGFARLRDTAGLTLAPDKGVFAAEAIDCNGFPASGVSFHADTADATSRPFYFAHAATGVAYDLSSAATTDIGVGGIFNVPAGPLRATGSIDRLCLTLGAVNVNIRAGAMTATTIGPSP